MGSPRHAGDVERARVVAYKAGHARREQVARLLGFPTYRKQLAFQRESPANRELVAQRRRDLEGRGMLGKGAAKISAKQQSAVGDVELRKRVFIEPDARFVRSNREAELRAFFRAAGRHDGRIVSAIVSLAHNGGVVDANIWAKGGVDAAWAWDHVAALIDAGELLAAKLFLVDQINAMGSGAYLSLDASVDSIVMAQMRAEW